MITYKREEFLSRSEHRSLLITGLLCVCVTIDTLRVEITNKEIMPTISFLVPALLFLVVSIFFLLRCFIKAGACRKEAIQSRNNYLQNGIVSRGTVTDAGGGYYQKRHYRTQYVKRQKSRHFFSWESTWWADIEYFDEIKGIYARRRVTGLNKNGKLHHLIGREVEVYHLDQSVYVNFK